MFSNACSYASPTMNFPEAIHPATGGGCMGDGHHGWAAAEVVLALRDAFVYERKHPDGFDLILLAGIPASWFTSGKRISIERTPVPGGVISIRVGNNAQTIDVEIQFERINGVVPRQMSLALPLVPQQIISESGDSVLFEVKAGESFVVVDTNSVRMRVIL